MHSKGRGGEWDFTPVIDLIHSLSAGHEDAARRSVSLPETPKRPSTPIAPPELEDIKSQLGNFDKLWKFLGQPLNIPPPCVPPEDTDALNVPLHNDKSAEQAFLHDSSATKGVRWRDELEGADLEDNDEVDNILSVAQLTKAQRKKERKKDWKRRQELWDQTRHRPTAIPSASDIESENELQNLRHSPDRRTVIQQILYGNPKKAHRADSPSPPSSRSPPKDSQNQNGRDRWPISNPYNTKIPPHLFVSREPTSLALAAAKKTKLICKLNARFVDERQFLNNISITQHVEGLSEGGVRGGVHVFVDASNVSLPLK